MSTSFSPFSDPDALHRILESAQDVISILLIHPIPTIVYISPSAEQLTGYSPELLLSDPLVAQKMIFPDDYDIMARVFSKDTALTKDTFRIIHKNGTIHWVEQHYDRFHDQNGNWIGYLIFSHDITAQKESEANLLRANQKFEAVFRSMPPAMVAISNEQIVTMWNPGAEKIFGWQADEILGKTYPLVPDDLKEEMETHALLAQKGIPIQSTATQRKHKDGHLIDVLITTAPLYSIAQRPEGTLVILYDLSQERKIQNAIKASAAQLALVSAQIPIFLWTTDNTQKVDSIFGKPELYRPWFSEDSSGTYIPAITLQAAHRRAIEGNSVLFDKAIKDNFYQIRVEPLFDTHGKINGCIGLGFEITSQRKAENALAESDARFRAIFDRAGSGIIVANIQGFPIQANQAFFELSGYSADEIGLKNIRSLSVEDEYKIEEPLLMELLDGKRESYSMEKQLLCKNGSRRWIHLTQTTIKDTNGTPHLLVGMLEDIDSRKETEKILNKQFEELKAISSISASLRQISNIDEICQVLSEQTMAAFQANSSALVFVSPTHVLIRGSSGLAASHPQKVYSTHLWLPELDNSEDITPITPGNPLYPLAETILGKTASIYMAPIRTNDQLFGGLLIGFTTNRDTTVEKNLLVSISEIAGTALHRMAMMDTLEQRVTDRTHDLSALYEISAIASQTRSLDEMLDRSLAITIQTIHANAGCIFMFSDGDRGEYFLQKGFEPQETQIISSSDLHKRLTRLIASTGLTVILTGLHDQFPELQLLRPRLEACIAAPMRVQGEITGVILLFGTHTEQFSPEEVALVGTIGDQMAVAMDNFRLNEQARQKAILEERERLARELHDSVTQLLYSVNLFSETGRMLAEQGQHEKARQKLAEINEISLQALKEMRLMVYELRPLSLQSEGLVGALQHRIDTVENRAGVKAQLMIVEYTPLPPSFEEALYRIAEQALNNTLKHAFANNVFIKINFSSTLAELVIQDNGKGMVPELAIRKGGLGLTSIRERAERLGGKLQIQSTPGNGTLIQVQIPLPGRIPA